MRFETEALPIGNIKLEDRAGTTYLLTPKGQEKLTANQTEYLRKLQDGKSVQALVEDCIQMQTSISFGELFGLVEKLVKYDFVRSAPLKRFFEDSVEVDGQRVGAMKSSGATTAQSNRWKKDDLAKLPFFRNLKPDELLPFLANAQIVEAHERSLVIKYGDSSRDLYALLEGEVSVYRIDQFKRRRLITIVPEGTVFGEGGFFFIRARSADVVTNTPCVFAKIKYVAKDFEPLFARTRTDYLQQRFWVLHALMSSPMFQNIPAESLDRFVIMGETKKLDSQQVLFKQGDVGNSFFVVIQGEFGIERNGKQLNKLKQGDVFGEIALMINNGERMATTMALTEGLVLEISRPEFLKTLSENLFLAKEIEEVALRRYNEIV